MEPLLQVWKTELCVLLMLLTIILGGYLYLYLWFICLKIAGFFFTTNLCYYEDHEGGNLWILIFVFYLFQMRNLCMTRHIVRTQAVLYLACTKLYHINSRCDEFKIQDKAVLLQIVHLYIMSVFLSCFLPPLWFDISFRGIDSPTLLARQTWLTTAGGQRAVFSPQESKSPPRSTVPKSLTQKTGSYVFGSGGVLQKRFPTDMRES